MAGGSEGQEEGRKRCKGEARPLNTCRGKKGERRRNIQKREIGSIEIGSCVCIEGEENEEGALRCLVVERKVFEICSPMSSLF